jgi:hypothetical protein
VGGGVAASCQPLPCLQPARTNNTGPPAAVAGPCRHSAAGIPGTIQHSLTHWRVVCRSQLRPPQQVGPADRLQQGPLNSGCYVSWACAGYARGWCTDQCNTTISYLEC